MQIQRKRGSPFKSAARLQKIVRVFVKHGFENFAHRARLGRFIPERFLSPSFDQYTTAERLRMAFEQLGPAFVKLGQLLATRPDLIPKDISEEFKKLHDQVSVLPFSEIEPVMKEHFKGDISDVFKDFDDTPIGAASISQVYQATLKSGQPVVIKVQRPWVSQRIQEDIHVLYTLARLLDRYVPESRVYNPVGIIDEFFRTLELETNFIVEANNIRRFKINFSKESQIKIPHVYNEYSGKKILVMEKLEGIPLSHKEALEQEGIDREEILKTGLRCYMKMVFRDGLFHGDLHAGNLFVLPDNRVGLIDFGIVGRLNRKTQTSIVNMLLALASEDYERLAYEYVDLAPYTDRVDVDRLSRELRDIIAPYYGLTTQHVDVGKVLMDSTSLGSRHQLVLPSELVLFFKSLMAVETMGKLIFKDFDFISHSLGFIYEIAKARYEPKKLAKEAVSIARDVNSLILDLPRQFKQFLRRMNSPDFSFEIDVHGLQDIRRSIEASSNILFLGLIIGSLILSASLIMVFDKGPTFLDIMPLWSFIGYSLATIFGFAAFVNYTRK